MCIGTTIDNRQLTQNRLQEKRGRVEEEEEEEESVCVYITLRTGRPKGRASEPQREKKRAPPTKPRRRRGTTPPTTDRFTDSLLQGQFVWNSVCRFVHRSKTNKTKTKKPVVPALCPRVSCGKGVLCHRHTNRPRTLAVSLVPSEYDSYESYCSKEDGSSFGDASFGLSCHQQDDGISSALALVRMSLYLAGTTAAGSPVGASLFVVATTSTTKNTTNETMALVILRRYESSTAGRSNSTTITTTTR